MPRYHVRYRCTSSRTDHVRVIDTEFPIEYDSDIQAVQAALAKVYARPVELLDWRELKGKIRPPLYHCVPCRGEWPSDRPCEVCARSAQPGPLPRGLPPVAP